MQHFDVILTFNNFLTTPSLELKHVLQKLNGILSQFKIFDFVDFWLPYL